MAQYCEFPQEEYHARYQRLIADIHMSGSVAGQVHMGNVGL